MFARRRNAPIAVMPFLMAGCDFVTPFRLHSHDRLQLKEFVETGRVTELQPKGIIVYNVANISIDPANLKIVSVVGNKSGAILDWDRLFTYDVSRSQIRTSGSLDYRGDTRYGITVSNQGYTVFVFFDVNGLPRFGSNNGVAVLERVRSEQILYQSDVYDPDGDTINYRFKSIKAGARDPVSGELKFTDFDNALVTFQLNSHSGEISVRSSLRYADYATYRIEIEANDSTIAVSKEITIDVVKTVIDLGASPHDQVRVMAPRVDDEAFGVNIADAGDVNGDGYSDYMISSSIEADGALLARGTVNIYYGGAFIQDGSSVSSPSSSQNGGTTLTGAELGDGFGRGLSSGDLNSDGKAEVVIGAPGRAGTLTKGKVYVFWGGSELLKTNNVALEGLDLVANDVLLISHSGDDGLFGYSVSTSGDYDGDGWLDILIGSANPGAGVDVGQGSVYLIWGNQDLYNSEYQSIDVAQMLANDGAVAFRGSLDPQSSVWSGLGYGGTNVGDINGDGIDDLAIPVPYATVNNNANNGTVRIIFGSSKRSDLVNLDLNNLDESRGSMFNGAGPDSFWGTSVSSAGDYNGDGINDFLIGGDFADAVKATGDDTARGGKAVLIFGNRDGSFPRNLDEVNGVNGLIIKGDNYGDELGFSVSSAGDINGDGYADIVIGSPGETVWNKTNAGVAYVVWGRATDKDNPTITIEVKNILGEVGFAIVGRQAQGNLGYRVSEIGDINNDGYSDILVSAPGISYDDMSASGEAYVVYGNSATEIL